MWKTVRRVLNKKHANNVPQDLSPDTFNDFFANVGAQLAEKFQNDTPCWTMPECIYQFKFSDVQHEFVHKLLLSLPLKTNLDVLHIDAKLLRLDGNVVTPVLCNIFRQSINEARVQDDFKLPRMTPIYKTRSPGAWRSA